MKGKGGVIQTQGERESLSLGQKKEPYIEAPFIYLTKESNILFTFLRVMGLFFRSEPPGLVFSMTYPCPARGRDSAFSACGGAAASPTDKSRKGRRPPASHFRKAP